MSAGQPSRPWKPQKLGGAKMAAVTGGSTVMILPGTISLQVRVRTKPTDADCFIEFGSSSVVAVVDRSYILPGGSVELLSVPTNATYIAAICASGSATVWVHSGEGA